MLSILNYFKVAAEKRHVETRKNLLNDIYAAIESSDEHLALFGIRTFVSTYGAEEDVGPVIEPILNRIETGVTPPGFADAVASGKLALTESRAKPMIISGWSSLFLNTFFEQALRIVGSGLEDLTDAHGPTRQVVRNVRTVLPLIAERDPSIASEAARGILSSAMPKFMGMGIDLSPSMVEDAPPSVLRQIQDLKPLRQMAQIYVTPRQATRLG